MITSFPRVAKFVATIFAVLCLSLAGSRANEIPSQGPLSPDILAALLLILGGNGIDSDGDGVPDDFDAFPDDPLETDDSDSDGVGDNGDAFPDNPEESVDTDGDGLGNNADDDDDGDGVTDVEDPDPVDPSVPGQNLVVLSSGSVSPIWDSGINGYDVAATEDCRNDGGAECPSIDWSWQDDIDRGRVLEVSHASSGAFALLYIKSSTAVDLSAYANGALEFDIKVISGDPNITMKIDCGYPCTSGDQPLGERGLDSWEAVRVPMAQLNTADFNIKSVDTGIVIWATNTRDTIFRLDNIRFTGYDPDTTGGGDPENILRIGAGSYANVINQESYRCVEDYGFWLYNAGVIDPTNLGTCKNVENAQPAKKMPRIDGAAASKATMTHRWWGSIPFGADGYITPDPIMARLSGYGARITGIPAGLNVFTSMPGCAADDTACVDITNNNFGYVIPTPSDEVMEAIAVGNSLYAGMTTKLLDYSEGSVTAGWFDGSTIIMKATFVQGSPYVFFEVYEGQAQLKSLRPSGGERGIWFEGNDSLGIWTNVAGVKNHFMVVGDTGTSFGDIDSAVVTVNSPTNAFTVAWLPTTATQITNDLRDTVRHLARNVVDRVKISYSVNRANNTVSISHDYMDPDGGAVETLAGMMPLAWKRAVPLATVASVRSARGVIKYTETSTFTYGLPTVGVLPALPLIPNTINEAELTTLVNAFVALGPASWNTAEDTYWNGKAVSRVAEVLALAQQLEMSTAKTALLDWLKGELADWLSAERDGSLDHVKYFVYDDDWDTLLGLDEAFYSHALLQDHHFHYGYFIRAAAEVCRIDREFCGPEQYGPMLELLIRDYAAGRDDPLFPYLRNFDPAFGFSWASGAANFNRGNNNESTSEAANAYGAMILYGLVTGNDEITERGMYLHASTAASFWEYWNDIDGYLGADLEKRNFPLNYDRITTSIIWGDGADFATWFSRRYAHILGIQGLPSNPLTLHVGLYADYLDDYVYLGMSESRKIGNGKPSGLPEGLWTDLWWNLWALTDADAAIADYETIADYVPETGESPAHTYHWLYTMRALGELQTGTGELTADYPAAMAFKTSGGTMNYVAYNFGEAARSVTFSDGITFEVPPNSYEVVERASSTHVMSE